MATAGNARIWGKLNKETHRRHRDQRLVPAVYHPASEHLFPDVPPPDLVLSGKLMPGICVPFPSPVSGSQKAQKMLINELIDHTLGTTHAIVR